MNKGEGQNASVRSSVAATPSLGVFVSSVQKFLHFFSLVLGSESSVLNAADATCVSASLSRFCLHFCRAHEGWAMMWVLGAGPRG